MVVKKKYFTANLSMVEIHPEFIRILWVNDWHDEPKVGTLLFNSELYWFYLPLGNRKRCNIYPFTKLRRDAEIQREYYSYKLSHGEAPYNNTSQHEMDHILKSTGYKAKDINTWAEFKTSFPDWEKSAFIGGGYKRNIAIGWFNYN